MLLLMRGINMNIVLHTEDFEPITIIDLPMWLLDQVEREGTVRVAVMRPVTIDFIQKVAVGTVNGPESVTIKARKLRWLNGEVKTIYTTKDEELALILKPDWLPGQRTQIHAYQNTINNLGSLLVKELRKNKLDPNV